MDYFTYKEEILSSDLSANAKLVALVIASHYNWKNQTEAFPNIETIAKLASISNRSVIRAKNELKLKGFITSKRRFNKSSVYAPQSPRSCQTVMPMVTQWPTNNVLNNEVNNVKDSNESFVENQINLKQEVISTFDTIFNMFELGDSNEERYNRPAADSRLHSRNRKGSPETGQNNPGYGKQQGIVATSPSDW